MGKSHSWRNTGVVDVWENFRKSQEGTSGLIKKRAGGLQRRCEKREKKNWTETGL